MKTRSIATLALSLMLISSSTAFAQKTNRNVSSFDIMGMRLYDSPRAIRVAMERVSGENPPEDLNSPWSSATKECSSERASALKKNISPSRSCIYSVAYNGKLYSLGASFVEDFPAHPGQMKAFQITVQRKGTPAERRQILDAAQRKYGSPDLSMPGIQTHYCARIQGRPACDSLNYPAMIVNFSGSLIFTDSGFEKSRESALQKYFDSITRSTISL